ncbi:MAG TPA: hypothetical protein VET48_02625 [Steroidobacteraceae bacterium]|nr:hypothetical protein [Steroidobacteraceae bacterium]
MKTLTACCVTLAALALPVLTQAADTKALASIQACMDKFVAENFANRKVTFVTEDTPTQLPLEANTGTRQIEVIARDTKSGKVLAKGTCTAKESAGKVGRVIVTPVE